ncbi:DUF4358 domain-containing protein [Faecalibacterium sp. An122]|uniref:DUF4358 domain-containing protein n=1 Tax=Faecalibacterium sp. An122 TaxID=1965551 RepID=UPI000B36AC5B|nr:DUF4358 domain-containing protein [Faecalibacterium sp. An122]OUQ37467.1 hypothetical protein B5E67_08295 [Faecalibacterium sp. An122]
MMKRNFLFSLTALILCAALLAGCGGSSDDASSTASSAASAPASAAAGETRTDDAGTAAPNNAENGSDQLSAIADQLLEANPISNQFEISAMNIEYDFGLAAEDVASYKGIKSNDNGDAGLVLVIQPAAGKSEAICEQLQTYKEDQVAFYGNYSEFAQAQSNVENAVISGRDNLVVMVIASNEATADLGQAVDDVMNEYAQ